MSIDSEITRIETNISNAYTALSNKGATLPVTQNSANLSSTIGSLPATNSTNCAGLCFWLDGDCNTRQGLDRSKTYFENLVWIPTPAPSIGNVEVWKTPASNSWNNTKTNMLNIGTNALFPDLFCARQMTLEAVVMFTDTPTTYTNLIATNTTVGYNFAVYAAGGNIGLVTSQAWDTSTSITWSGSAINTPHYVCVTFNVDTGVASFQDGLTNKTSHTLSGNILTRATGATACSGVFGKNNSSSTTPGDSQFSNIAVGMIRAWNKVLSNNEIIENYNDAKNRFGCI